MGTEDDTILHPRFSPDRRGLISELVRRLAECEGLSDAGFSEVLGARLGRAAGPLPTVIGSWRTGWGGPPPGDVVTIVLDMARRHPELAALVDALIGQTADSQSDTHVRQFRVPPWLVFISRTSELRDHPAPRSYVACAEAAIVRAGHAVADMTYFVAGNAEPAAHCIGMLSAADLYVGIIGFRYGALVPGRSQSFTELEFETATALGLTRLVFLLHDDAATTVPDGDQTAELADRQNAFRGRLQDSGVTTVTIRSPHELELSLLHAMVELAAIVRVETISAPAATTVAYPLATVSATPRVARLRPDGPPAARAREPLPEIVIATSLGSVTPNVSVNEPVGYEYIAAIRRAIQQFIGIEIQMGSNELAPLALRYLRSARRRLDAGHYDAAIEQELQAALAELAQIVAWLLHDAGRQDAARQAGYEALHLARLAGSPQQLDLFILGNLAHVEIFTGRPGAALRIARAALDTSNLSSRLTAMFRIREARALAQLGDRAATERALQTARSELLDGISDRDPQWSWWLDEPEFVHHSGQAFASLGVHDRALSLLEQASEDCPSTRVSGRFIYLAHSLTEAVEASAWSDVESIIEQTMPYAHEVGSGRTADVLLEAASRLEQVRATPNVRDAGRHLRAVLATSTWSTHPTT